MATYRIIVLGVLVGPGGLEFVCLEHLLLALLAEGGCLGRWVVGRRRDGLHLPHGIGRGHHVAEHVLVTLFNLCVRDKQTNGRQWHKTVLLVKKRKCAFKVHLHWTIANSTVHTELRQWSKIIFFCFRVRFRSFKCSFTLIESAREMKIFFERWR